jgi:hypothetical protein
VLGLGVVATVVGGAVGGSCVVAGGVAVLDGGCDCEGREEAAVRGGDQAGDDAGPVGRADAVPEPVVGGPMGGTVTVTVDAGAAVDGATPRPASVVGCVVVSGPGASIVSPGVAGDVDERPIDNHTTSATTTPTKIATSPTTVPVRRRSGTGSGGSIRVGSTTPVRAAGAGPGSSSSGVVLITSGFVAFVAGSRATTDGSGPIP